MAEMIVSPEKPILDLTPTAEEAYLKIENCLGELDESLKSAARANLGTVSADDVYTKTETERIARELAEDKFRVELANLEYISPEQVANILSDYVKNDGTTPFLARQTGVTPLDRSDLTTKGYVDNLIAKCLNQSDKEAILLKLVTELAKYAIKDDVYSKSQVYNKEQVEAINKYVIKRDGSVAFTAPLKGKTPLQRSDLSTKGYVDDVLSNHKNEIDPHNLTQRIADKLSRYVLKENVYQKGLTYSRSEVNQIINRLVDQSVLEALRYHLDLEDPHGVIEKIIDKGYVTNDGSMPFTRPQKGVDAVNDSELVTLKLLNTAVETLSSDVAETEWITSGPVLSTVGFINEGDTLAKRISIQEIFDAIFYGASVNIYVPDYANLNSVVDIEVCLRGALAELDTVKVLQNGIMIHELNSVDFEESNCIIVQSNPITEDTEFTVEVTYTSGATHTDLATTKVTSPVFIGVFPYWKALGTITYDYLQELVAQNPNNNGIYAYPGDITSAEHEYSFADSRMYKLVIILPESYPNLKSIDISSQLFSADSCDKIAAIPMRVEGQDFIYKAYVYKQPLVLLNIPVTYNFEVI